MAEILSFIMESEFNGKPGSAIRLSETVKTGEGQQRDTHPDDN